MKTHVSTVSAGDFKARCLKLMDEVALTRRPLLITKHGRAVARVVPVEQEQSVFGCMQGTVQITGDIVAGTGAEWNAAG